MHVAAASGILAENTQLSSQNTDAINYTNTQYHSQLGSMNSAVSDEDTNNGIKHRQPIYNLYQLMQLRRAVAPRYIHLFNQKQYAASTQILQKGILFTYNAPQAKQISIAGDFNNWTGVPMQRNHVGVFFHILALVERENGKKIRTYNYKFIVDGVWQHDPQNKAQNYDDTGALLSTFYLSELPIERQTSVRILHEKHKSSEQLFEFSIYLPRVKHLVLVGSFNNWNPEHDIMHKGADGYFPGSTCG